jgi:hypothetical protein
MLAAMPRLDCLFRGNLFREFQGDWAVESTGFSFVLPTIRRCSVSSCLEVQFTAFYSIQVLELL